MCDNVTVKEESAQVQSMNKTYIYWDEISDAFTTAVENITKPWLEIKNRCLNYKHADLAL